MLINRGEFKSFFLRIVELSDFLLKVKNLIFLLKIENSTIFKNVIISFCCRAQNTRQQEGGGKGEEIGQTVLLTSRLFSRLFCAIKKIFFNFVFDFYIFRFFDGCLMSKALVMKRKEEKVD